MKRIKHLFLLLLLFTAVASSFAQSREYPVIRQNGKDFYLYEVKGSDGLFRISKNFKVSQEEILKYNQHAVSGINKGMKILIPIVTPIELAKQTTTASTKNTIIHKVEQKETLYGIARQYGVSADDIRELNEETKDGIKLGMELKIPESSKSISKEKQATSIPTTQPTIASHTKEHTIIAKETLYSLSKLYNVSINDLIKLNPELSDGLKIGQVIKVPSSSNVVSNDLSVEETPKRETINTISTNIKPATPHPYNYIIKVALLMPFMLNSPDKQDATINKFIEFYEGVLIAIDRLKNDGVSVQLITYDIEKTEAKVKEVLQTNYSTLKKADLIIGPAYSSQVKIMSNFAQTNYIPLVVPFTPNIPTIDTNPYIFQNNTPHQKQFAEAAKLFMNNFYDKNIIIIDFNNDTEDIGSEFAKFLKINLKRENIAFKELQFTQEGYATIQNLLVKGKETILLYATDKPNIVSNLFSKIAGLNNQITPISVFGFSGWEKTLKNYPSTYYYTSFFVDRKNKNNGIYRNKFHQEFGYTSSSGSPKFDLMGFDLASYFIKAISLYGKSFYTSLNEHVQTQTIQSRFQFEKQGEGGFINTGVRLIHYTAENDCEIIE